jgi:glyoxylase-like metal-dependent hydrolase (beta-lactamase superfamily II)
MRPVLLVSTEKSEERVVMKSIEVADNVLKVIVNGSNNVYLVMGERAAFFDSGFGDDTHQDVIGLWDEAGKPEIAAIIVSHWHGDHAGGAKLLSEATGAPVYAGPREKAAIEFKYDGLTVDYSPIDGESLDLGGATIRFVHTPGHTNGSLSALYMEQRILFTGDTTRTADPFHLNPTFGSMDEQRQTIGKLRALDLSMIGCGHGPEVDDPQKYLAELVEDIKDKEW